MPDEVTGLINRLEGGEAVEEVVFPGEPGAISPKGFALDVAAFDVDLTVALHDVVSGSGDRFERYRALAP